MNPSASGTVSNLPSFLPKPLPHSLFHLKPHRTPTCFTSGTRSRYYVNSSQKPTTSGDSWSSNSDKHESDGVKGVIDTHMDKKKKTFNTLPDEEKQEDVLGNFTSQVYKFFEGMDIKFSYEEYYPILAFGGGGVVALWLAATVVEAVESIPLFPKVMELVGLAFTLWFTSRFLIFKENRDELVGKIKQVKKQVVGSEEDDD